MALSDYWRATIRIRVDDKLCSCNMNYLAVSGVGTLDGAATFIEGWITQHAEAWQDILAMDATIEGVTLHCLAKEYAIPGHHFGVSTHGLRDGNAAPANQCLVLTLQHGDPDAVRQGRIFISGCSKNDMVDGQWSPDFIEDKVRPLADILKADLVEGGATWRPVVLQRVQGGDEIEPEGHVLTGIRVNPICYSQSRRTTKQHAFGPLFVP